MTILIENQETILQQQQQQSQSQGKEIAAPNPEQKSQKKGIVLYFILNCEKNQFQKYLEKFQEIIPFKCNLNWVKLHYSQNQEIHRGQIIFKQPNQALEFIYLCNYCKIFKYHLKIQEKIHASKFLQLQQNHRFVIESVNNQTINFQKINQYAMKYGLVYTIDDCNNKNTMAEIIFYHKLGAINFMKNFKKIDENYYLDSEKLQLENNDKMKVIKISDTIKKEFQFEEDEEKNFLDNVKLEDLSESFEIEDSQNENENQIKIEQNNNDNNQDIEVKQEYQENQIELEELQKQKQCINCNQNDKSIIYQPCGHFLVCLDCKGVYSKCKICQSDIIKGNQIIIIKKNQNL